MTIQNSKLIAAGEWRSFVLKKDGLFACGYNTYGQLGIGNTTNKSVLTPVKIGNANIKAKDVIAIAAGKDHTLVLTKDGLFACGDNRYGQLGIGGTNDTSVLTPVKIGNANIKAEDVLAIAAGQWHSLVLKKDGLFACGYNRHGQLGIGDTINRNVLTPVKIGNTNIKAKDVIAIAAGQWHSLVLTKNGLFACGYNRRGQLGIGNTDDTGVLTPVKNGKTNIKAKDVIAIADGGLYYLVLTKDGLFACGDNRHGQLGIGDTIDRNVLTPVKIGNANIKAKDVIAIAAGQWHSLVLTKDGLFACGYNRYGQLGIGNTDDTGVLTPVKNGKTNIKAKDVIAIAAGRDHTLILTKDGLFACGDNTYGQLGINSVIHRELCTLKRIVEPVDFIGLLPKNEQEKQQEKLEKFRKKFKYCDALVKCNQ